MTPKLSPASATWKRRFYLPRSSFSVPFRVAVDFDVRGSRYLRFGRVVAADGVLDSQLSDNGKVMMVVVVMVMVAVVVVVVGGGGGVVVVMVMKGWGCSEHPPANCSSTMCGFAYHMNSRVTQRNPLTSEAPLPGLFRRGTQDTFCLCCF